MLDTAAADEPGNLSVRWLGPTAERLRQVHFGKGEILRREGELLSEILFLEDGLVSVVNAIGSKTLETGLLGRADILGASAILGARRNPSAAVAHTKGVARIMSRDDFDRLALTDRSFRRCLHRHIRERMKASTHAVIAAARCTIEERLAGWLLRAQDRAGREAFQFTHDRLANALGVRRPGITVALHMLEGRHAIRSRRGLVEILSRSELRDAAGCAYLSEAVGDTALEPLAA